MDNRELCINACVYHKCVRVVEGSYIRFHPCKDYFIIPVNKVSYIVTIVLRSWDMNVVIKHYWI